MKTKILLFIAIMSMTLTFAQSKQIDKILDNSKDGVTTIYKDGTSVVKTVYKDVKSLSPKVEKAIGSLAEQFKTTTNNVWNILVRQQLVWSIGFLILTLTSIFNWYLFYKRNLNNNLTEADFIKGSKKYDTECNPEYDRYKTGSQQFLQMEEEILLPIINPNNNWFKYLHLIICMGLSVLSIYHFGDMLTGFINPEFGALKTIAEIAIKLK